MRLTIKGLTLVSPRTATVTASARGLVAAIDLPAGEIPWEGLLTLEGIETGDERIIAEGGLTWADLPLPFTDGHDYERILGRLDTVTRDGNMIRGSGVFADTELGREGATDVALGLRRGLSIDMDAMEGEIRIEMPTDENGEELDPDEPQDVIVIPFGNDIMSITSARIRGVALCTIAAFAEAQITTLAGQAANAPGEASMPEVEAVAASACSCGGHGTTAQNVTYSYGTGTNLREITAAGFPDAPPVDWFTDPHLTQPTGIVVTPEGRVFGHLAGSGCHRSFSDRCVTVARATAHTFGQFNNGPLVCADGSEVKVGQLTLVGGHAGNHLSAADARRHYDDTNSAVADIVCGWDEANNLPWFSGALRSTVTPAQVRALRAQGVSGDWRPHGSELALIALSSVPVEGWPVEEVLAASGEIIVRLGPLTAGVDPVAGLRAELDQLRSEVGDLRRLAQFRTVRGA